MDAASGMHISIQIAEQIAETIWKAFATRMVEIFDKAEGRGIFVEPTPAEAHWQMGQVENNGRYLRQM